MGLRILLATLSVIAILAIGFRVLQLERPTQAPESVSEPDYTIEQAKVEVEKPTPERLLELTNEERVKVGVKPLVIDERLNQSAQNKANELEQSKVFSHTNEQGVRGAQYAMNAMPECIWVSENITDNIHTNNSESAINAWMVSESHREALLDPDYEYVGFGVSGTKIAQHFCDID